MTDEAICSERYLSNVRSLAVKSFILKQALIEEKESMNLVGYKITEKIAGTRVLDKIPSKVERLQELVSNYSREIEYCAEVKQHAYDILKNLEPIECTVLFAYYFQAKSNKVIAREISYSDRSLYLIKQRALQNLYEYLPNEWRQRPRQHPPTQAAWPTQRQ